MGESFVFPQGSFGRSGGDFLTPKSVASGKLRKIAHSSAKFRERKKWEQTCFRWGESLRVGLKRSERWRGGDDDASSESRDGGGGDVMTCRGHVVVCTRPTCCGW